MLQPEVTVGPEPPVRVLAEWRRLADANAPSPFLYPEWYEAWWEAFGRGQARVLVARRRGRLVGCMPLQRRRGGWVSATNWDSFECGFLAADDAALTTLARGIFEVHPTWLGLDFLELDGPELGALRCGGTGYRLLEHVRERSPYVPLEGDWEHFRTRMSNRRRSTLRRRRRQLGREGAVRFEIHTGEDSLERLLTEGFRLEGSGWKAAAGTAILSTPATSSFYREIARWAAQEGWLRLVFLRVADRPVAFMLCLERDGVMYYLKGGYEESLRPQSPGILLLADLLEHLFPTDVRRLELLGGAEPYKLEWTDDLRTRVRLLAFAPGPLGTFERWSVLKARPFAKQQVDVVKGFAQRRLGMSSDDH